jgi:ribosome assembly protein 1
MVVKNMPNPRDAQKNRVQTLISFDSHKLHNYQPITTGEVSCQDVAGFSESKTLIQNHTSLIKENVEQCNNDSNAPLVVFISKMMPVRVAELSKQDIAMLNEQRQAKNPSGTSEENNLKPDQEVFMALGRVFSGYLKRNSDLYVIGHKYDPCSLLTIGTEEGMNSLSYTGPQGLHDDISLDFQGTVTKVKSQGMDKIGCYVLLGPSVFPAENVGAGNIVGIVGLEDYILKTATISDSWACYPLKAITFQSKPMLKVAVEPASSHKDLRKLEVGLQSLYQFDPVVEIGVDDNGQHTMTCLGELHLDQCVKALIERFAK